MLLSDLHSYKQTGIHFQLKFSQMCPEMLMWSTQNPPAYVCFKRKPLEAKYKIYIYNFLIHFYVSGQPKGLIALISWVIPT